MCETTVKCLMDFATDENPCLPTDVLKALAICAVENNVMLERLLGVGNTTKSIENLYGEEWENGRAEHTD